MTDPLPRLPLASVALLSCAALATEILLTRSFSILHWHHFAFMIISLALLGYGVSGTFLALTHRRLLAHFAPSFLSQVASFGVLAVASPTLARALPFHAEALLWDPWQPLWLVLVYLVLSLPFFCAANAIGLALIAFRERAGRVYAADLIGAGLGGAVILGLLYLLWPGESLRLASAAAFVALIVGAVELRARIVTWSAIAVAGAVALFAIPDSVLRMEPGPYKSLSQALLVDGARILLERSSPLGRLSVVESPRVPIRHVPGLSLSSRAEPPPQLGLYVDGNGMEAVTAASDDPERLAFLAETTSALAYRIGTPGDVLVLGAGGGLEVLRARQLGARTVAVVELNPQVAELLQRDLSDYTGQLFEQPGVSLHLNDARGFLAATDRDYDLIQISLTGGAGGGLGGLNEDYAHTVEAFRLYLEHLAPGGLLSITGWVQIPPRQGLRLVATVLAALEERGVEDAAQRLLMIRGWQTATLLVKNGPLEATEIELARAFCDALAFDFVWFPGIEPGDTNLYNELRAPWYFTGVRALLGKDRAELIADYAFDIRPATDDRPYFHNYFRWPVLVQAWGGRDRGGMALLEAGYLLLVTAMLQALVAGLILILLPLRLFAPLARTSQRLRWRVFLYFTAIGLAFLFVEIAFLQKLVLLVHHPTVAFALVLATFLIAAGTGSAYAGHTSPARSRVYLAAAIAGIVSFGACYALAFDALIVALAASPTWLRGVVAAGLLAPLAFCMGFPFPLALRELDQPLVPWAWGVNGCASVVSAVLATLLAIDFGFGTVLWLALALYAGIFAVFPARDSVVSRA